MCICVKTILYKYLKSDVFVEIAIKKESPIKNRLSLFSAFTSPRKCVVFDR